MREWLLVALTVVGCSDPPRLPGADPPGITTPDPCDPAYDVDEDGDGYTSCTDCADDDPTVYPGATDVWYDGVDSDCDGRSDYDADGDGDDTVIGGGGDCDDDDPDRHSLDRDGDGVSLCDEDCDDDVPSVHPGAERVCGDGIDNDCDGLGDCEPLGQILLPDGEATQILPLDAADFGTRLQTGDLDGDGRLELLAGTNRTTSLIYVFDTQQPDLTSIHDAVATVPGWPYWVVADVTGDGLDDVSVMDDLPFSIDPIRIYPGPLAGDYGAEDAEVALLAYTDGSFIAGDVDGDEIAEMMGKSASHLQFDPPAHQAMWVARGPIRAGAGPEHIDAVLYTDAPVGWISPIVAGLDLTGDGIGDLLASDSGNDESYVVSGLDVSGMHEVHDVAAVVTTNVPAIAQPAGDIDRDGYEDLAVPAQIDETGVSVGHLLFGPFLASVDVAMEYDVRVLDSGYPATPGDHDADGHLDLVLKYGWEPELRLLYGPIGTGTIDPADFDGRTVSWSYDHPDFSGADWVPMGDLDDDGTDDIAATMGVVSDAYAWSVFLLPGAAGAGF